jgi:hypothetical protein
MSGDPWSAGENDNRGRPFEKPLKGPLKMGKNPLDFLQL